MSLCIIILTFCHGYTGRPKHFVNQPPCPLGRPLNFLTFSRSPFDCPCYIHINSLLTSSLQLNGSFSMQEKWDLRHKGVLQVTDQGPEFTLAWITKATQALPIIQTVTLQCVLTSEWYKDFKAVKKIKINFQIDVGFRIELQPNKQNGKALNKKIAKGRSFEHKS